MEKSARSRVDGPVVIHYNTPVVDRGYGGREIEMDSRRNQRKIERSAEEKARLTEIRARIQAERPGLQDLLASGDATEVVSHGEYLDLLAMLAKLKRHREAQGLSLTDVADRSGMDRSAVSRLENGQYLNPTMDTLYRYARAIGAEIGFSVHVPS
jgi:DNA-binding XRE family transcriptional regulator